MYSTCFAKLYLHLLNSVSLNKHSKFMDTAKFKVIELDKQKDNFVLFCLDFTKDDCYV